MRKNIFRFFFLVLPLGGALFLLIRANMLNQLSSDLNKLAIGVIVLCFIAYFLIYLIDSLRLKIMLETMGPSLPFRTRFTNSVVGGFFSNITPFSAGGQPFQIYHLHKSGVAVDKSTALISIRLFDHLGTSVLVSIASLIYFSLSGELKALSSVFNSIMIVGLSLSCSVTILLLLALVRPDFFLPPLAFLLEKIRQKKAAIKLRSFSADIAGTLGTLGRKGRITLIADFFLGAVNLSLQGFSLWFSLQTFALNIPNPAVVAMLFILTNLVIYMLPTPGASGGVEGAYTLVFNFFASDIQAVAVAVFMWRFATFYLHLLFQLVVYTLYQKSKKRIFSGELPMVGQEIKRA